MHPRFGLASSVLALCLSAPAALAITPDEVWANWQALAAAQGSTMTAAGTAKVGTSLEVTGLSVTSAPQPEVTATVTSTIDKITFADQGDGTVKITMSDSYPVEAKFSDAPGQPPVELGLTVQTPGLVMIASGSPAELVYDYTAPTLTATLTSLKLPDGKVADAKAEITATALAGHYVTSTQTGGGARLQSSATLAALALTGSGTDPSGSGDSLSVSLSLADLKTQSDMTFVDPALMQDLAAALKAGFAVTSTASTGAISLTVDATSPQGPAHVATSFTGAGFDLALGPQSVAYGFSLLGAAFDATVPEAPIPVKFGWGEFGLHFGLPIEAGPDPKDASAVVRLVDVTMDETLWSMFDPGQQLKRDPVTLILDLAGKLSWNVDILQPGALDSSPEPANFYALDLKQVLAKAVGTEITATGGLTFDNSDKVTFGGIPAPSGKITVTAKGINALIDTLVAMGLVPEDQVMGARMMLAMFAKPGAGPDELVSELEFKDKAFLVNGQALPF